MFANKEHGSTIRLAMAAFVLGGAALAAAPAIATAQSFVGGGGITADAYCYLTMNKATVSVTVANPPQYASSGLIYNVQLWAKRHSETKWNLITQAQSPTINTWTNMWTVSGWAAVNNPTTIFTGAFTGRYDGVYDIYIQYWDRAPSANSWSGPFGFNVAADAAATGYMPGGSAIHTVYPDGMAYQTADCNL
jgi:hypothetical protein